MNLPIGSNLKLLHTNVLIEYKKDNGGEYIYIRPHKTLKEAFETPERFWVGSEVIENAILLYDYDKQAYVIKYTEATEVYNVYSASNWDYNYTKERLDEGNYLYRHRDLVPEEKWKWSWLKFSYVSYLTGKLKLESHKPYFSKKEKTHINLIYLHKINKVTVLDPLL